MQLRMVFTLLLFAVNIHSMFGPNWPSSSVQVALSAVTAVTLQDYFVKAKCTSEDE
jgi:hypothetical protein